MIRLLDLVLAALGLLLLSPFLAVVAFVVWWQDRGPVLFAQTRIGRDGRPFAMFKFRTMVVDADKIGASLTVGADRRITPVGRFLRATKLDELPQLWNVVRGDMSLVGPRPEVARYVDLYTPLQREVLRLRPGVTDLASFAFYNESDVLARAPDPERFYIDQVMPEKIRINLAYAARAGVVSYLAVILATVMKVLGLRFDLFGFLGVEHSGLAPASAAATGRIGVLGTLLMLYLIALHFSMAGMELLAWLIVLGAGLSRGDRTLRGASPSLLIALALFPIWVAVSLWATPLEKPFTAQLGFMRWVVVLVGLRAALGLVWNDRFETRLLRLWTFVLMASGLYGVLQFFTGVDWIRPGRGLVNPQGGVYKAVGPFSMSLTYAYSIGLSALAMLRRLDAGRWALLAIAAGIAGVFAAVSRGAVAGVLAGLFLFLAARKPSWILPAGAVAGAAFAGGMILSTVVREKIIGLLTLNFDHSSFVRVDLWRGYWAMFVDHPLLGVGLLEGDRLLPGYFQALGLDQTFYSHAHNNFLQFLAGSGLVGFALFTFISCWFLRAAWRLRRISPWGWPLVAAQVFFHIGGLTECNFLDGEVNHMLMWVWAQAWLEADRRESRASGRHASQ